VGYKEILGWVLKLCYQFKYYLNHVGYKVLIVNLRVYLIVKPSII